MYILWEGYLIFLVLNIIFRNNKYIYICIILDSLLFN
jgi:hypothetical protein